VNEFVHMSYNSGHDDCAVHSLTIPTSHRTLKLQMAHIAISVLILQFCE
jgi:hypothetical protein